MKKIYFYLACILWVPYVYGAAPAPKAITAINSQEKAAQETHYLKKVSIVCYNPRLHNGIVKNILSNALGLYHDQSALEKLNTKNIIKIMYLNQEPIGLIAFERIDNDCASITWIAIQQKFQNKGLGSILITHAINIMRSTCIKKIILVPENEKSLSFYEKHGFIKYPNRWRWECILE